MSYLFSEKPLTNVDDSENSRDYEEDRLNFLIHVSSFLSVVSMSLKCGTELRQNRQKFAHKGKQYRINEKATAL